VDSWTVGVDECAGGSDRSGSATSGTSGIIEASLGGRASSV
jgi:hypothetical protein